MKGVGCGVWGFVLEMGLEDDTGARLEAFDYHLRDRHVRELELRLVSVPVQGYLFTSSLLSLQVLEGPRASS